MSQQIFNKHWPLAKNGANELIPGAAILQTRDDKDEPITLAAAVQWDESSGLFLPTHKENPLEVRVRELEAKLDELKQTIESGVQLKGRITEPLHVVSKTISAKSGEDIFVDVPISDNGRSVAWDIVFLTPASLSAFIPRLYLARNTNNYTSAANAVAIGVDVLDWMEIYHRSHISNTHMKTLVLRGSAINAPLADYLRFEIYNESSDSIIIHNARLIRYYPKEVPAS